MKLTRRSRRRNRGATILAEGPARTYWRDKLWIVTGNKDHSFSLVISYEELIDLLAAAAKELIPQKSETL